MCLWWESSLLSASSLSSGHHAAGSAAYPHSGQPSISPEPGLTSGDSLTAPRGERIGLWALWVRPGRVYLGQGSPALLPRGSIFSSKDQPGPGLEAFPFLWGLGSHHTCSGVPETAQLLGPELPVSLALRVGVAAFL